MPILNDKLLKAVKTRLPKEGFSKNFWRSNRANAASGSGVAKVLDSMRLYGVSESGSAAEVDVEDLGQVISLYDQLHKAIKAAKSKCGKMQSHTSEMCDTYMKLIPKLKAEAVKRLPDAAKAVEEKGQPAGAKEDAGDKAAAEKDKTDKELAAFLKAAAALATELDKGIKLATDLHAAADATNREISSTHGQWMSQNKPGSANAAAVTKAALSSIANTLQKHDFKNVAATVKQLSYDMKNLQTKIKALGNPAGSEKHRKALVDKFKTLFERHKIALSAVSSTSKTYTFTVNEMKSSEMEGT